VAQVAAEFGVYPCELDRRRVVARFGQRLALERHGAAGFERMAGHRGGGAQHLDA